MNYSAVEVTFDKRLLSELMFVNLCYSSLLTFSFLMNLVKEITKIISYSFTAESSYQVSSFCYFKSFSKFLVSCGASIDFHPPSEHCVTLLYETVDILINFIQRSVVQLQSSSDAFPCFKLPRKAVDFLLVQHAFLERRACNSEKQKRRRKKERKLKNYRSASDPDVSTLALARDQSAWQHSLRLFRWNSLETLLKYQHGTQGIFDQHGSLTERFSDSLFSAEAPAGYPYEIAIIEKKKTKKKKRAGDDGKTEKAGASLLYFPFSSFSARSLFLFPQPPHNTKSPLRRTEVLIVIDSGPDCKRG